ncbi:MAG: tRNA-uridine aminocarboxypropyltransferase [Kofleriaceae bacterium]
MSRRGNAELRCPRCRMLGELCVCGLIPTPPLATGVALVLVVHRLEARKPTNTGQLAAACLAGSQILERGHEGRPSPPFVARAGTRPLLLFPADDAVPLDQLPPGGGPVTLIVPDGTWRQARRVRARVPGLADVPCVTLPPGPPSRYQLRSEPREGGLATIEAIARAYALLGEPAAHDLLDAVFRAVVERTLWSRGTLATAEVSGGLAPGVQRHAPRRPG